MTVRPSADPARTPPALLWRAALLRTVLAAALWWILTEGALYGWVLALLSIGAAVTTSLLIAPPPAFRWRLAGLLRFVPFFLWQSIRGGVDVARRALHPRLPIEPDEFTYPLAMPAGPARTFFAASLSLFPGTLSLELRGDRIIVHTLDRRLPAEETLHRLERQVAELFGVELR